MHRWNTRWALAHKRWFTYFIRRRRYEIRLTAFLADNLMNSMVRSGGALNQTNSRSMRYTCLDVRSPDVNFLRKVMSSSRHDGAAYSRHPCRQSADADIVSAFPLPFSTFLENINILRQTSSTWHRIRREFCVLESFQKNQ